MPNKKVLEKIRIVYAAIKKPGSWYTGLAIKEFLHKQYFNLSESFENKVIKAGRWSAYAHFNADLAFENILDKHDLKPESRILVHPLLPANFVDILINRKLKILTLDISKNTLNWNKQSLLDYIRQLRAIGKEPDLIIQYSFNGLVSEIVDSATDIQSLAIPNLIVLNQENIGLQVLQLWSKIELGSVLWFAGSSFIDDELGADIEEKLEDRRWYISWYLEARTKSILEYNLSKSQEYFNPIIEAYFYILLDKLRSEKWWAFALPWGSQFVNSTQFKNVDEAKQVILNNYGNLEYIAMPDIIFELENSIVHKIKNTHSQFSNNSHNCANSAKKIYHSLSDLLPRLEQGSMEIPEYYLSESYYIYFFYTVNPEYWSEYFQTKSYPITKQLSIHKIFEDKTNLTTTKFIANYYFGVEVST